MLRSFLMPPILAAFLVCTACDVPNEPPEQQPAEDKDPQPNVPKTKSSAGMETTTAALEPSSYQHVPVNGEGR